ncbi:MAG: pyruvate formate lyase family protein [Clostridia bacterium]|nr:pyruvate formate lyase family protein [Clostridia bacterium]
MHHWNKEASALNADLQALENKYHDTSKDFNAYARFLYHGWEYDPATGLDDAEMDAGLAALNQTLQGTPHPIHKAKLFAFVLDHTRIEINEHDYFVGIYTNNRPLAKYTSGPWGEAVYASFPEERRVLGEQDRAGAAYGWLDFDHTVPDWDRMMALGFPGLLAAVRESRAEKEAAGTLTDKQRDFACGMEIAYEAILRLIDRLAQRARTMTFAKAEKIAVCLEHLRDGAPQDMYDAMQMIYLYFMLSECIDNYQVRSLGFGLDTTLRPYFERGLAEGTCTVDSAAELLGYFLMQWSAIGNYWGQPFYMGGMHSDGTTKVNALSYLILEVYDKLGIYNPKIQIKINRTTPKDFVLQALEMIRHGNSSIVFCSDDIITRCLMSRGATYEEAVDSVISGCYEYKCKSKDIGACGAYFNALKPISLVLDNGVDTRTGLEIGKKTGALETLSDFAAFYRAYLEQLAHVMLT